MQRKLLALLLLPLAACQDVPLQPEVPYSGPVTVSVAAAGGAFVRCGEEIPLTVTVTGTNGKPVAGFLVNFNVLEGGGRIFGGAALTNRQGVARDIWTIGGTANTANRIQVRAVDPATGQGQSYAELSYTTASRIVFNKFDGAYHQLFTANPDGTDLVQLTHNTVHDMLPAWSPDGRRIAFLRGSDLVGGLDMEIFVMNADGSGVIRLTHNGFMDGRPTWSPDNQRIAFGSLRPDPDEPGSWPRWDIYVVRADGTGETRLTSHHDIETHPAWSPDGRRIAFTASRTLEGADATGVWIMNSDGTGQRPVSTLGRWDQTPAWSPDGRRLAFVDLGSSISETRIVVTDADGTGRLALTNFATGDIAPSWSPDGGKLVFTSRRDNEGIYTMNADGSGVTLLANTPDAAYTSASWSGCTP